MDPQTRRRVGGGAAGCAGRGVEAGCLTYLNGHPQDFDASPWRRQLMGLASLHHDALRIPVSTYYLHVSIWFAVQLVFSDFRVETPFKPSCCLCYGLKELYNKRCRVRVHM